MIVLSRIGNFENDRNLRIKKLDVELREVMLCVKNQPVGSALEGLFDEKKWFHSSVIIRPCMTQFRPGFIRVLDVEMDSDAAGGGAARNVEYMRRDGAHCIRCLSFSLSRSLPSNNRHRTTINFRSLLTCPRFGLRRLGGLRQVATDPSADRSAHSKGFRPPRAFLISVP
jgi:hypothetical protein